MYGLHLLHIPDNTGHTKKSHNGPLCTHIFLPLHTTPKGAIIPVFNIFFITATLEDPGIVYLK